VAEIRGDKAEFFEPGTYVISGTVKLWRADYGELLTDSGVTIPIVTQGHPMMLEGARLTLQTRKLRPLYMIDKVIKPE
jgi:hypothetical protein